MSKKAQVAGSVVAGFPSPAEQYLEPPLDLNELLVKRPAATFFVRVEGDSMIGAGIRDKDLLVVDRSLTPANGDIIIASVDGEFTVKTLRVLGNRERGMGNRGERGNREWGIGNRESGIGNRGERGNGELGIGNGGGVRYVLEPANPNYPSIEIKKGNQLDCFGVVTSVIHQFKGGKK